MKTHLITTYMAVLKPPSPLSQRSRRLTTVEYCMEASTAQIVLPEVVISTPLVSSHELASISVETHKWLNFILMLCYYFNFPVRSRHSAQNVSRLKKNSVLVLGCFCKFRYHFQNIVEWRYFFDTRARKCQ